jgi:acyl dehydratase
MALFVPEIFLKNIPDMPETQTLERTFTMADQQDFSAFCGDYNPIHVDMLRARRTQAGAPVVHGIHILLWTVETILRSDAQMPPPLSLKARFRAPLLVGNRANIIARKKSSGIVSAKVLVGETICSNIELGSVKAASVIVSLYSANLIAKQIPEIPADVAFENAISLSGRFHMFESCGKLSFPRAEAALGPNRIKAIGFISTLVGMICPGLHSLMGSVDIDMNGPDTEWIDYNVVEADERFRRIVIEVVGAGINARVEAFFRMPPVTQPSVSELAKLTRRDEFASSVALVVGGSRGLGALTAKILATWGTKVLLTYAVGAEEAAEIQQEIRQAGGACKIVKFDALQDNLEIPTGFPKPTHIYYFATPKIFLTRKTRAFSRAILDYFLSFYVDGLERLVRGIAEQDSARACIFNPSTVAIPERMANLAEYAMAKAASEVLTAYLERSYSNIKIVSPRLPRLLTDQTALVSPVKMEAATDVMLPLIRTFHSLK